MKYKFIDRLNNFIGKYHSFIRYILKLKSKKITIPKGYKKTFGDNFKKDLDLKKWRLGQPWGNFHSRLLNQYYDTEGKQSFTENSYLNLKTEYSPKKIIKSDLPNWRQSDRLPDEFTIPNAIGLITSRKSFKYGIFKANIKLPIGQNLWPAFWLCGDNSWPPEIDIFEAFTKDDIDYRSRFFFKTRPYVKIEPNLHFGNVENNSKRDYGPYKVPVRSAAKRFVEYTCWWEKDFIKIYYDGIKVFQCTDKNILKWFNDTQYVVLSNGIREGSFKTNNSNMLVKNISIYQK